MKRAFILSMALVCFGCSQEARSRDATENATANGIVYFKDRRTDLCFAMDNRGMTNVPCTIKVERLIAK